MWNEDAKTFCLNLKKTEIKQDKKEKPTHIQSYDVFIYTV